MRPLRSSRIAPRRLSAALLLAGGALVAQAQTTVNVPVQTVTRTSSFTYHPNGLIATEVVEPDGTQDVKLTSTYTYDARGNRLTADIQGWNGTSVETRSTSSTYDADYLYTTGSKNALDHAEEREYDPRWGGLAMLVGPNGITTRWSYDEFGRKSQERRGYASKTATTYLDRTDWVYERCADVAGGCASANGVTPVYRVSVTVSKPDGTALAPVSRAYYDSLNREIRTETQMLSGGVIKPIYKDTVYNSRGQVLKVSLPYFYDATPQWVSYTYDITGRKETETSPTGIVTSTTYAALRATVTVAADEGSRSTTSVQDPLGRTIETIDSYSRSTWFVHDAKGNLERTVDTYGNTVTAGYDIRGRKTSMNDPDLGAWTYEYNAFGELIRQVDPKSRAANAATQLEYDKLGRLKKRTEPDLTTQYEYDSASHGVGKLASTWTDNGYCRQHAYDTLGRPDTTTSRFGTGTAGCMAADALTSKTFYDDAAGGRVLKVQYPTGVTLRYNYNAQLGFLQSVDNYTGGTAGTEYWRWTESDAGGRVTAYRYGNNVATLRDYAPQTTWLRSITAGRGGNAALGDIQQSSYEYDSIGNLRQRADRHDIPNLVEKFTADLLGRLTGSALYDANGVNMVAGSQRSVSYDAVGNIKAKSDVGTYYYNPQGGSSVRPHAVTAVRGALNNDYAYDANGNMLSGGGRSFTYTSYNMVASAGTGSTCHQFQFQSEHMRSQQRVFSTPCSAVTSGTSAVSTTWYLHPDAANGLSFEREQRGAATNYKHYINAGGIVVGMLVTQTTGVTSNAVGTMSYFHYDHLGSVVAITDAAASANVERRSFDPWGKPRNTDGSAGSGELPGGMSPASDRGYTMHEHLEGLGLVHMNGRVFDPTLARFMSADPFVQAMFNGQSYNRYSYVLNDPLDATDPSGYFLKWLARKWRNEIWRRPVGRMMLGMAAAWATMGMMTDPSMILTPFEKAIVGAVGGFAGGAVSSGGDLKAATRAALTGGAFGFVGGQFASGTIENYAGHALVGCASAVMDGGKCGSGATGALWAKFATIHTEGLPDVPRGIAAAVAGGIGAEITGGSFKNGAQTAAYGYLFNHWLTRLPQVADRARMLYLQYGGRALELLEGISGVNGPASGYAAARAAANGTVEGVYIFSHISEKEFVMYVGQSGNIAERLYAHLGGKLDPAFLKTVVTLEVQGGKFEREVVEQKVIDYLRSASTELSNIRNPIGPARVFRMERLLEECTGACLVPTR